MTDGDWLEPEGARRPLVLGHRGASAYAPENTLAAFGLAVEQGADGVELDVHRSRDGRLVVCHDAAVERTTDGEGLIHELTLAQLQGFDAGYRFSPDDGWTFPFRGRGLHLPVLEEVFAVLPPDMPVNVELKAAADDAARERLVADFARFLAARPALAPRILVSSFDHRIVDAVGALRLGLRTGYLVPAGADLSLALDAVVQAGHGALHPHESSLLPNTGPIVERAHAGGVAVNVWTVDDPQRMRELIALGVDAIITNRPDVLLRSLGEGRAS